MILDGKKIFVAGATGSVGSAIVRHILDNFPRAVVRASYRTTEPFIKDSRVEYVRADLRVLSDCRRAARGCNCAVMAASHSGGSKVMSAKPWSFVDDNTIMNTMLFEAFFAEGVKRAVYIGTATVYQESEGYIREDMLDMNIDPHPAYLGVAWVSRFIEKLGLFWHNKTGLEVINIRAANIFGPYSSFNPESSYFIPAIIRKAVAKMDPFVVWGSPDVTRDVIYAQDFARAVTALLEKEEIKFDVFNIGSGVRTTVGDVVNLALKYAEHKPSAVNYDTSKPSVIKFRALDVSKIKSMTSWRPDFGVDEGIKKTVEWWTSNKDKWTK
jgi:nucleoside-diphosphate-sugar epimerase